MKIRTLFISILLLIVTLGFSQSSYYYYKGTKVPLQLDKERVSVITNKEESSGKLKSTFGSARQAETIEDTKHDIVVYKSTTAIKPGAIEILEMTLKNHVDDNTIVLPCYKTTEGKELTMTNYLDIKLKNENDFKILQAIASEYHLKIVQENEFMSLWYTLTITPETQKTTLEVANEIFETGLFASSTADFSYDARECSWDPDFNLQWGLYNSTYEDIDISICAAWNYSTGRGVKIAIVDQGIDMTHRDLTPNIYDLSYDTETGTSPSKLYGDHGTHCAGIAAAVRNNGLQMAGVAPDAKLMSVSNRLVMTASMNRNLADGINWAWQNGADIISCSWWTTQSDILEEAIDNALFRGRNGRGAVFVKSSGNTGGPISYPGDYRTEVLTVGSIGINGVKATSSGHGNLLDVVAPGVNIWSTILNNNVGYKSGTSMAAPHATGVAALILARNPSLSSQQVRDIIEKNTKKIRGVNFNVQKPNGTWNIEYGYGLINAYEAVKNTPRY